MPGNRQAFDTAINAADHYRWDSRWTEAAVEYQRAIAEFPEDATARSGLGFCYMQTRQWPQALHEYEYTLKRDPSNVIALSKTAELYGILDRRNDAYRAYLHLADLYSQAGQGARAEAAWQKAVQLSRGDPEPHERLATYYYGKKDIAMMIQERLAAAQGHFQRKDFAVAQMQCEEVLRADATNKQAQQMLSSMKGQMQEAQQVQQVQPQSGPLPQGAGATFSTVAGTTAEATNPASGPLALTSSPMAEMVRTGDASGGNTGIMGNMGNASNFGGGGGPVPPTATAGMNGGGMDPTSRRRITASQVTGVLRQAQTFQTQGRFNDAIDLCEQILESGFDRPDARYFLGWLYQEQQRWDEAIRQYQMLINDPDYALSCYYALGQCYRARGDLRTATLHFDEAVDRVNLDALNAEESEQLVQLCQEAAEAHRLLGEQEQAVTVYSALLGFLRSRGWSEKVAQVEFMMQQMQHAPAPARPVTPPPQQIPPMPQMSPNSTMVIPPEQMAMMHQMPQPLMAAQSPQDQDAATMTFNMSNMPQPAAPPSGPLSPSQQAPKTGNTSGDLPDWLTGILSDGEKTQVINNKPPSAPLPAPTQQQEIIDQPTTEQRFTPPIRPSDVTLSGGEVMQRSRESGVDGLDKRSPVSPDYSGEETTIIKSLSSQPQADSTWLTEMAKPGNVTRINPPDSQPLPVPSPEPEEQAMPQVLAPSSAIQQSSPVLENTSVHSKKKGAEDLLSEMAGASSKDESLKRVAETVLASTDSLPDTIRLQVAQSMQDIQKYINHGLLTPATDECLHVIDMAPQYLDVHQVLCEIYVRQGKVEQAITKYAILVDTYIVNGRLEDAIATYRRILQLEPNNLTYRVRLINLLSAQGNKEDLLRERTLAAESYLRLGYMDRALTELEQALQESPTSISTRLNYGLALHKLGRTQQAVAEYQRVLQVDPRNITALVRWHISMITQLGTARANSLEVLTRIRWQLRGEGQRNYDTVAREYNQAAETHPNNADVHFASGQIHQQAGHFDRAIDSYLLAMRDSAVEVMARLSAAQCLVSQSKPDDAIQQLEQALQSVRRNAGNSIDPSTWAARPREEGEEHQAPEVEISLLLAKAYGLAGKQEQMQALLRQVKQTTTYQDEVSSTLAEISARQGDVESALNEYTDLVRHYRSKRQTENALNVLNEMVRMAPQDPRAHDEMADIYVSRGLLDEGIAELRLLADIHQRRDQKEQAGAAYQRIGNIYAEMDNTEEALVNLRRGVDLMPNSMDLLREIVGFCLQLGRTNDAAQYQVIMARYYFETHQVKEAVAALQQLITIDRNNYEAYDLLGQTYQSVGEYEQASRVYRNLAKVNPENAIARERLASLQELRTK